VKIIPQKNKDTVPKSQKSEEVYVKQASKQTMSENITDWFNTLAEMLWCLQIPRHLEVCV